MSRLTEIFDVLREHTELPRGLCSILATSISIMETVSIETAIAHEFYLRGIAPPPNRHARKNKLAQISDDTTKAILRASRL